MADNEKMFGVPRRKIIADNKKMQGELIDDDDMGRVTGGSDYYDLSKLLERLESSEQNTAAPKDSKECPYFDLFINFDKLDMEQNYNNLYYFQYDENQ